MAVNMDDRDRDLVDRCLSGSELAWTELYYRFQRLVGMLVKRRLRVSQEGLEDVTQEVFMVLTSALKNYDSTYPLPKYVCTIAERVCIDQYRFSSAAKRDGETEPLEDHILGLTNCQSAGQDSGNQEDKLVLREQTQLLRQSLRTLGERCRELLRLRYLEELQYSEISEIVNANENTLAVQVARCVRELRASFQRLVKKGAPQ
jgi:RNA polymerase sigma factor (sigma-70 family)